MFREIGRALPSCALGFVLAAGALAQPLVGGWEDLALGAGASPADPNAPQLELVVPDFDPARDVPAMANWIPDTTFEGGAAHCFAMSVLTHYFHRRVRFVAEEGAALSGWTAATPSDTPMKMDAEGLAYLFEFLSGEGDEKLVVAGSPDLRAFTAEGAAGEALFRRVSEAIQFSMQIPTSMGRYSRNIIHSKIHLLDRLDADRFTIEGINQAGVEEVRQRLAEGRLAPITMHPPEPRTEGHVLVAYAYREFQDRIELEVYDSNAPPLRDRARPATVTFQRSDWSAASIASHAGAKVYTSYTLMTPQRPDRFLERQVLRRIVTHLDRYLLLTRGMFAGLERGQEVWREVQEEFIPGWKAKAAGLRDRLPSILRRRLGGDP